MLRGKTHRGGLPLPGWREEELRPREGWKERQSKTGYMKADVGLILDLAGSQLERRIHRILGLPGRGSKGNMGGRESLFL